MACCLSQVVGHHSQYTLCIIRLDIYVNRVHSSQTRQAATLPRDDCAPCDEGAVWRFRESLENVLRHVPARPQSVRGPTLSDAISEPQEGISL
jgi:hypothetical protein